jgi:nudix-type nucleoside diphosphatase (YffH/AdpP family)
MPKVLNQKVVFNNIIVVEEAEIRDGFKTYTRTRVNRQDGAAVLVYNTESRKIILTKQFRYPIASKVEEEILEILAGKVDEGEDPRSTALREAKEEIGYEIKDENLTLIASSFASPGYTSELSHLYYAEVKDADRVNKGGGLKTENEDIKVIEMKPSEFFSLVDAAKLSDTKTLMAGLWLKNKIALED